MSMMTVVMIMMAVVMIGLLLDPYWTPIGPLLDPYWTPIGPLLDPYWTMTRPMCAVAGRGGDFERVWRGDFERVWRGESGPARSCGAPV